MEVLNPVTKMEEQYPLLEGNGAGDSPPVQYPRLPLGWGVPSSRKKIGCSRWPEFMSVCWMTTILCGISFMVIYGLGVGAYRRQKFVFLRCNDSQSASNVFYHHIVPRGEQVPFIIYSEYLAYMARQYPYLRFKVFFLIDDSFPIHSSIHNRFMNKLTPHYPYAYNSFKLDENCEETLVEFLKRFQNVNVTIMYLSKYMSGTPLRYKWRTIATAYLPFYARAFSVWENGGIGMDLAANSAIDDSSASRKRNAILRQHNDGIDLKAYVNALNTGPDQEETAIFSMILSEINPFLNDTSSFFNTIFKTFSSPTEAKSKTLSQSHRTKRAANVPTDATADPAVNIENSNISMPLNSMTPPAQDSNVFNISSNMTESNNTNAKIVLFYDFQIVSDSLGPAYLTQPLTPMQYAKDEQVRHSLSHLLTIDIEGTFIAASSRLHPLLGHLILAGCQRLAPRFAIHDAIISQCSILLRDVYCNNIHIL